MKLSLVSLALLQQALCAQQPVSAAELQSDLQSDHLNAWIESIATKRKISKEAVRSNMQAVTYHLDPADPQHSGSSGGGHANLERRQQKFYKEYPHMYFAEQNNDPVAQQRVEDYNGRCRRANAQPPDSPYTPSNNVFSFWRAVAGDCMLNNEVLIYCKLPTEYGPRAWDQNAHVNIHKTTFQCPVGQQCTQFLAHNYLNDVPVMFGGCTSDRSANVKGQAPDGSTVFSGTYVCPIARYQSRVWDIYAISLDNQEIEWTISTGVDKAPFVSRSLVFLFSREVMWLGPKAADKPYLKFARAGKPTKIRLYAFLAPPTD